jgi:hypothetical protein
MTAINFRFDSEEELGREGKDSVVGMGVKERAIGGGLKAAQSPIEGGGAACGVDLNGNGEVELIDIAGADEGVDFLDALGVLLFGQVEGAVENWVGAGG